MSLVAFCVVQINEIHFDNNNETNEACSCGFRLSSFSSPSFFIRPNSNNTNMMQGTNLEEDSENDSKQEITIKVGLFQKSHLRDRTSAAHTHAHHTPFTPTCSAQITHSQSLRPQSTYTHPYAHRTPTHTCALSHPDCCCWSSCVR